MSIHTKPLTEITWADIEALAAERVEEGQTLEFKSGRLWDPREKRTKPRDETAEAVVSFANAFGGRVIIGVDEDPETSACALTPGALIRELTQRATSLENAVRDIIEPKLAGLQFKTVLHPTEADAGVLIIRVPQSLSAPHGFLRPAQGFVRRGRSSEGMTMRDLQSVFWEARTRRERVDAIREDHRKKFLELVDYKADREKLRSSLGATQGIGAPGAVVRLSAVFQSPLTLVELNSDSLAREIRPRITTLVEDTSVAACHEGHMRLTPIAHGFYCREPAENGKHRSQFEWLIRDDGTLSATGWNVGYQEQSNAEDHSPMHSHYPGWYALSGLIVIAMARNIAKRANSSEQTFEIDMEASLSSNAVGNIGTSDYDFRDKYRPQMQRFQIGPFAVSDQETAIQSFRSLEREIWRAFSFENTIRPTKLRGDLEL